MTETLGWIRFFVGGGLLLGFSLRRLFSMVWGPRKGGNGGKRDVTVFLCHLTAASCAMFFGILRLSQSGFPGSWNRVQGLYGTFAVALALGVLLDSVISFKSWIKWLILSGIILAGGAFFLLARGSFEGWIPVSEEQEVITLSVLRVSSLGVGFYYRWAGREGTYVMETQVPIQVLLQLREVPFIYQVLLLSPLYYRLSAVGSTPIPQENKWDGITCFLPGIEERTVTCDIPSLSLFRTYTVLMDPRGKLTIREGAFNL